MSMRTLNFGGFQRGLASALVAALFLSLVAPPAWAQGTQTQVVGRHRAFVVTVRGTVEVKTAGQTNWTAARANTEIRTGDRVRTGANSTCRLKVGDVGEFDVQASSEITVGNLQQVRTTARAFFMLQRQITRDDVAMDLRSGDLRSSFNRQPGRVGNYNVHTPVAVAGVRGTKFELDLEGGRPWYERLDAQNGDGEELGLTLIVGEGEVGMMGPNWERTCRGGQQLHMRQGQIPGQPGPADDTRVEQLLGDFSRGGDTGTTGSTNGDTTPSFSPGGSSSDTTTGATGSDTEDPFAGSGTVDAGETFDTNAALVTRVDELFAAYENKRATDFMGLIDYGFGGVNNQGGALTYSTLAASVQGDMSILSSVEFNPIVTSITRVNGGFKVGVTWNGRFRFATVDTEVVRSGMTTQLVFNSTRPFFVTAWEGASPFGLTAPATGVTTVPVETSRDFVEEYVSNPIDNQAGTVSAPAPIVSSISGMVTNRVITGRYTDFAPYRVSIVGSNFQPGARVQLLDDELNAWRDAENFEDGLSATPQFQSSTLLQLDFIQDKAQYLPDDPTTEVYYWRVVNPDGKVSSQQGVSVTTTPGPLEITGVTTSRPITDLMDQSPVMFEIEGYNFVLPLQVVIAPNLIMSPGGQAVTSLFNLLSPVSVTNSMDGYPVRLRFDAQQVSNLSPYDHYVNITDARNQVAGYAFPVTQAPPPTNISWTTNQTLTSNFVVASGQTLTIGSGVTVTGTGGAVLEINGQLSSNGATFQNIPIIVGSGGSVSLSGATVQASGLSQPAIINQGGTLGVTSSSISGNPSSSAVDASSGNTTLTNVTMTDNMTGVYVNGGNLSLLSCSISGGSTGLMLASGTVTASGGTISGTSSEGINIDGGQFSSSGTNLTVQYSGSNNVRVGGPATVSLANMTLTGATSGIMLTSAAGGASVQATNITVSGSSGPAVVTQGGQLSFLGNCSITGTSGPALQVHYDATLSVSGSNNSFSAGAGSPAAVVYSSGASGSLTFGSGTAISGGTKAMEIAGNGTVNINAGVTISGASSAGVFVDGGNASVLVGAAVIQNNGGEGVLAGNCSVININGADILNNSGFGVARTGPGLLNGYVSLNNVRLSGNNGQAGSDLNTSPNVSNSSQYNYLTNPPNSVSSPR